MVVVWLADALPLGLVLSLVFKISIILVFNPNVIVNGILDLLDLFAFRVLVVRSGRLSNLHNLLGE